MGARRGGHEVTFYGDVSWVEAALRSLNRKHATEMASIHNDMLELGRILGVPYDGLSSPAGYLHGDLIPAMTALLKELGRLRQDLAAEKFNRREWQDRARDMERERDAALAPEKAASEPLPEMGQPEFGFKTESLLFRFPRKRKAGEEL